MFVLKKIVTLLLMPMSLCLGVLGVGILLLWVRRRIGAAKIMLTLGLLVLAALSFSAVADQFIKPLELWHPPLLDTSRLKDVKWVVVLGGGHASSPTLPPNAQIGSSSLARLVALTTSQKVQLRRYTSSPCYCGVRQTRLGTRDCFLSQT